MTDINPNYINHHKYINNCNINDKLGDEISVN